MSVLTDTFTLANGTKIPQVGFGTWQIPEGTAYGAVTNALKAGYRHVDTAAAYHNERDVGRAVRESGIDRKDIFVTTKLPSDVKTYDGTKKTFEETLKRLGLDYVDLYLIHAPWPWDDIGRRMDNENQDVWRAMEELYESGKAKAIGVSNFDVHDLHNILKIAKTAPMVDQIQYYAGFTEPKITGFCKAHNILVEAYSPLATGDMLHNADMLKMAEKYKVSILQLALRFVLENDVLPLPKATSEDHIVANTKLDFTISKEDMATLNALPDTAPDHFHNPTQG